VPAPDDDRSASYYEELQEQWPERASRRRTKRAYRRKEQRRIVVRGERLDEPDTARMSRALLAAQRELARMQAERDARAEARRAGQAAENSDG
jgi:hypothetical protein